MSNIEISQIVHKSCPFVQFRRTRYEELHGLSHKTEYQIKRRCKKLIREGKLSDDEISEDTGLSLAAIKQYRDICLKELIQQNKKKEAEEIYSRQTKRKSKPAWANVSGSCSGKMFDENTRTDSIWKRD